MTWLKRILAAVLLGLVAVVALTFALRQQLVFPFEPTDVPPQIMPRTELRQVPAFGDSPALTVWVTEPEPDQPVVVYFMGAEGALAAHEPRLAPLAEAGFGIAAMAYRGGGGQPGTPSEAALHHDALRVYAGLDGLIGRPVPDSERVIYGYSLGAALAARLAVEQEEFAVILEAPFTRICDTGLSPAARLPYCLFTGRRAFADAADLHGIGAPLLVQYGEDDDRVPPSQSRAVFDAAVEPKFITAYPGAGHLTLPESGATDEAISFIRTLRGER